MVLKTMKAGRPVVKLIGQCVAANQPLLIIGGHGIGKSELFKAAADELGVGYIPRDLSLMEPADLVGIPHVGQHGRTCYAPPSFLPREGRGLLVIEELNRAAQYMLAPCLQLLTERELNDYRLPEGWVPMAAINPQGGAYQVSDLDPALLSRFLQVQVEADPQEWAIWATEKGNVHPKIVEFVQRSSGIFAPEETNPRAWTYASSQLRTWERGPRDVEMLLTALAGLVGETWAIAFYKFLSENHSPLTSDEILERYEDVRITFLQWMDKGQFDLATASLKPLKRFLRHSKNYDAVSQNEAKSQRVRWFVSDLPADLRRDTQKWLQSKGYGGLL